MQIISSYDISCFILKNGKSSVYSTLRLLSPSCPRVVLRTLLSSQVLQSRPKAQNLFMDGSGCIQSIHVWVNHGKFKDRDGSLLGTRYPIIVWESIETSWNLHECTQGGDDGGDCKIPFPLDLIPCQCNWKRDNHFFLSHHYGWETICSYYQRKYWNSNRII